MVYSVLSSSQLYLSLCQSPLPHHPCLPVCEKAF